MNDSLDRLPAAYQAQIARLVERANGGTLPESEAHAAFRSAKLLASAGMTDADAEADLDDESETTEEVDVALFLEALLAAGVELTDEFTAADLEQSLEKARRLLAVSNAGELETLDAYSQWRRDATHHPILSRADETELTHRYAFCRKAADGLQRSCERLAKKLAAAEEVRAMLADDPDSASLLAAQQETIETLRAGLQTASEEHRAAVRRVADVEAEFLGYNYRLALFHATRIHEQSRKRTDLMDLIQQGNEGMMIAFRKFDPTRGFKFSTFATWHIRQKISEFSYEQGTSLKIPVHRHRAIRKINEIRRRYYEEHGEQPSVEAIAERLGKSVKKVNDILSAEQMGSSTSLDTPLSDEKDAATIGDLIADQHMPSPETMLVNEDTRLKLTEAMERLLSPRERRVVMMRFGLYDGAAPKRTLEQIGARMNITRERVRQIEARALLRLQEDPAICELYGKPAPRERRHSYRPSQQHVA